MALPQKLSAPTNSAPTDSVNPAENLTETLHTPEDTEALPSTERRRPLLFEPEPAQRMVVVRRRKKRRSQKVDKAERAASHIRLALFGLVILLLLVAVSGQHFAQALLEQFKGIVRPVKGIFHAPKLEVVALVIAALILLYMMPGVESTLRRWLKIDSRSKQKPR